MILTQFTLIRFYHVIRVYTVYSYWFSEDTEKILNDCRIFGGREFAIKCELKERPFTILLVAILVSIFVFGYALRSAELPYIYISGKDWTYLWNGMWCIIITMTTVGYGDYFPMTYYGRSIGVIASFFGTLLVSLMIVSLTIAIDFTMNQEQAFQTACKYYERTKTRD